MSESDDARRYLGSLKENQLDNDVRGILSFEGCPEILRASRLTDLQRRLGVIFKASAGSNATYELSHEVSSIDIFLSHNWIVSRYMKAVALSVHFYWTHASVAMILTMFCIAVVTASGLPPKYMLSQTHNGVEDHLDPESVTGFVGTAVPYCTFLSVLAFYGDFASLFRLKTPSVFLDKTCISQVNADRQRAGIERLSAFLFKSQEMIVLYSETYLSKVWTTYEVGMFVALHGHQRLNVLPVSRAVLLVIGTLVACLRALMVGATLEFSTGIVGRVIIYTISFFLGGAFVHQLRSWEREKARVINRLRSVRVQDCEVAVEADRSLIYGNITKMMQASQAARPSTSQEEALACFNSQICADLTTAFMQSFGKSTFKYKHYATLGLIVNAGKSIDFWATLPLGNDLRRLIVYNIYIFTWCLGIWMYIFLSLERLASCFMKFEGWKCKAWVLCASLLVHIEAIMATFLTVVLREKAEDSDSWLVFQILSFFLTVLSAAWLLEGRGRCRPPHRPLQSRYIFRNEAMSTASGDEENPESTTTTPTLTPKSRIPGNPSDSSVQDIESNQLQSTCNLEDCVWGSLASTCTTKLSSIEDVSAGEPSDLVLLGDVQVSRV